MKNLQMELNPLFSLQVPMNMWNSVITSFRRLSTARTLGYPVY